jgi:NADPH-dependent 2,4-dienoyl-CoA reductase/sulfur reductase-like enzyme
MAEPMRIVVVGCGAAGLAAATHAKSVNERSTVVVLEKRRYAVYHPCSIPDAVAGLVELSSLVGEPPLATGLEVRTSTLVEDVDVSGRVVHARDLRSGGKLKLEFDALVLATGSKPSVPRGLRIEDSRGVFAVKTLEDAEAIAEAAGKHPSAAVVGGSVPGVELAHALARRGVKVALLELSPHLLPGELDSDVAREVEKRLEAEGVALVLGDAATEISGEAGAKRVVTGSGRVLEAGFVVIATGVRANSELARRMGLEIGATGGVRVDERMATSTGCVYAAGGVAEVRELLTGRPILSPFASTAYLTGRVAGVNAAGGEARLRGVLRSWVANIGGFKFGATGLTETEAREAGFNALSATVAARDKPALYPDSGLLTVKLVADGDSGRVLGAQVAGEGDALGALNLAAAAVTGGFTVEDLCSLELAYAPSLSELVHPLRAASEALLRRLGRAGLARR